MRQKQEKGENEIWTNAFVSFEGKFLYGVTKYQFFNEEVYDVKMK